MYNYMDNGVQIPIRTNLKSSSKNKFKNYVRIEEWESNPKHNLILKLELI